MTDEQYEELIALMRQIVNLLDEKRKQQQQEQNTLIMRGLPMHHKITDHIAGYDMARHVDERKIDHD